MHTQSGSAGHLILEIINLQFLCCDFFFTSEVIGIEAFQYSDVSVIKNMFFPLSIWIASCQLINRDLIVLSSFH